MDYSVDHAKSIFDLIESVSPYAFPLLVSLIFPFLWIILKKLFGFSNTVSGTSPTEGETWLQKVNSKIVSFFTLRGDAADMFVFYSSVLLFFIGGVVLKVGEYKEEQIRQRALSLKHHFKADGHLFYYREELNRRGYSDELIDNILYKFPEEFIEFKVSYSDKDSTENTFLPTIVCIDSTIRKHVTEVNYALVDSYLRENFKTRKMIYLDSLFQNDTINVKNYFTEDIIYGFLSSRNNKDKFNINVVKNRTVILKNE